MTTLARVITLFITLLRGYYPLSPFRAWTTSQALYSSSCFQIAQQPADHIATDAGTELFQVRDAKIAVNRFNRMLHEFGLRSAGGLDLIHAGLKFFARLRQDVEQEIYRWPGVVFAYMPSLRALFEHFVVALLVLFDKPFEA